MLTLVSPQPRLTAPANYDRYDLQAFRQFLHTGLLAWVSSYEQVAPT